MSELFNLLLLSLVCYRLAQLLAYDDGPFDVFLRLRAYLGGYTRNEQGRIGSAWGRLVTCPYCLGLWIALPLALYASGTQWYTLAWWLGIAGLQAFLQSLSK